MTAIRLAFILVLAAFKVLNAVAGIRDSRNELIETDRCVLAGSLQAVYERPSAFRERDRFLILSVKGRPQAYVQCMFADNRKKLYCEASSGYYAEPDSKPRMSYLPQDSIVALGRLGFATGTPEKNFPYERDLSGTPDFDAIATLMLSALHDAYGAREDTLLDTYAPFVGTLVVACRR